MTGPRAALIVIDLQNAFVAPATGAAVTGAAEVVEAVNRLVDAALARGEPVFYTRDVGPTELPAGDPDGQTDLAAGLDVRGTIVPKGPGRSGGFSGFVLLSSGLPDGKAGGGGLSALPGLLRDAEVDSVVVAGIATDVCVSATARDARRLGYPVTIPLPATPRWLSYAKPGSPSPSNRRRQ